MEQQRFVNDQKSAISQHGSQGPGHRTPARPKFWQPSALEGHRRVDMPFVRGGIALILAALCSPLLAQPVAPAPAPGAAAPPVSSTVRPALAQIGQTLNNLNIRKWKAPGSVRSAAEGDVQSIQRDLTGTLAALLDQSDAAPTSVTAAFSVYRNVNALYDTLLRVVETAGLAAPDQESSSLDAALVQLESARNSLANEIQNGIVTQQAELHRLQTVIAAAAAAPRPAKTTVVDDGPTPVEHHRTHTTRRTTKKSTTEADKEKEKKPQ